MRPATEQLIRQRTASIPLEVGDKGDAFTGAGPAEYRHVIAAAGVVAAEAKANLQRWVDAGRREGMSWSDIGETLGITKQAAQQRFRSDLDAGPAAQPGQIEVRLGATAFNEERILDEEGLKGHELVRVGMLALVFRKTMSAWEYRRVAALNAQLAEAAVAAEGWTHVASWFPFHYFKRPASASV